jgi:hypothetical protein
LVHSLEERRQREFLYKAERKKERLRIEQEEKRAKEERKQQKELRNYSYVCFLFLDEYDTNDFSFL